jgi:nicotinamidase-related amidase
MGNFSSYADRIEHEGIIGNINQINRWARTHNYLVIHVRIGFDSNYVSSSSISPIFKNAKKNNALNLAEWGC